MKSMDTEVFDDKVKQIIDNAFDNKRVFPSYLFVGIDREIKLLMSKYFASKLNCVNDNTPCGICANCKSINDNKFHSFKIFSKESEEDLNDKKKKKPPVEKARELRTEIMKGSYQGYLVVYVERAEGLTSAALNVLLKMLEDIPKNVMFIFDVANQYALLSTIRSRSQTIIFKSSNTYDFEEKLTEQVSVDNFCGFLENKNVQELILYVENNKFERDNVKKFLIKMEAYYIEEFKKTCINKFLQLSSIVRKYHLYLNRPVSVVNNLLLMFLELKECNG